MTPRFLLMLLPCALYACDPPPRTQPSSQPAAQPNATPPEPTATAPAPEPAPSAPSSGKDYDPCVGRPCGAPCNICAPDDANCVETAVVKACNEQGQCIAEAPKCPPR